MLEFVSHLNRSPRNIFMCWLKKPILFQRSSIQIQLSFTFLFHRNWLQTIKIIWENVAVAFCSITDLVDAGGCSEQFYLYVEFRWMTVSWHKAHNELHTVCKSNENSNYWNFHNRRFTDIAWFFFSTNLIIC